MVPLSKGQTVAEQTNLRVCVDDGKYADTDLILCAEESNPDLPTAMLQAQYVKYGPVVYQFNTPEELGAAIFALDAKSAHDAVALYKEQVARDTARNAGTLEPGAPVAAPDALIEEEVEEVEEPEVVEEEDDEEEETATTTPTGVPSSPTHDNSLFPPDDHFSTTTPSGATSTPSSDLGVSTTTPSATVPTSTPPMIHDIIPNPSPDLSTTTTE